jgi:hypothetical protein
MTGPLSAIGLAWDSLADHVADWSVYLLRRTAGEMSDALDRAARRDIEGAADWRAPNTQRRYPS